MKTNKSDRILRFIAFLSLAAVFVALISQHIFGMEPCAWCVLQRLILLVIAAVCLILGAGWGSPAVRRLAGLATLLLSISGVTAAWYQYSVAAHSFSCAQTFADRFISGLGVDAAAPWLFGIYASCMDARRTLLGVEYSLWGLMTFVVCGLLALWALAQAARPR